MTTPILRGNLKNKNLTAIIITYHGAKYLTNVIPESIAFLKFSEVRTKTGVCFSALSWLVESASSLPTWVETNFFKSSWLLSPEYFSFYKK